MLSVDRLNYIKRMPLRIDAIEAFLARYPEYVGKVVLLQLNFPSREDVEGYRQLHAQIEQGVSRVNGKFGTSLRPPNGSPFAQTLLTRIPRRHRLHPNPVPA